MASKENPIGWITLVILVVLTGLVLCTEKCGKAIICGPTDIDTVVVEREVILPPDTVTVIKYHARIIYRDRVSHDTLTDTIYFTKPFYAYMDTTINCTSVKLRYSFPENTFDSLRFVSCPDTVRITDTTITKTTTVSGTFWDDLEKIGLGFIGGFVVGVGIAR